MEKLFSVFREVTDGYMTWAFDLPLSPCYKRRAIAAESTNKASRQLVYPLNY
jgi:hypothetical protein